MNPPEGTSVGNTAVGSSPVEPPCPAERFNRSAVLSWAVVGLGGIALTHLLVRSGSAAIDLNLVNTVFLIAGLLLHRDLGAYVAAVTEGGKGVVGIVLQFPLYGGIHALMREAGLAAELSSAFVDASHWTAAALHVSPAVTFPVATLLSAGLLNLFIPSGGGQWIVQGPIMCAAASAIGMPIEQAVMAVSYGDEWTNMMQPFWAVPLMGLTGVDVRAFMGYCILIMLLATPVYVVGLLLF